ncbi:aldehyde dehydrogenase [Thozetella sp. PMI_491]|nr:aldehyde dehydrogenase [Thozetella sp. PMI_491]
MAVNFDTFCNIIDGQLCGTAQTRYGVNPSTLNRNPDVPLSTPDDVERAVVAGERAAQLWAETSVAERRDALTRFADAFAAQRQDFANMLVREQGKPLDQATGEIEDAIWKLRGVAKLSLAEEITEDTEDRQVVIRYVPIGVSVGIVPWNSTFKIGPAIMAGSPIIIKPSPFTPYCGLKLVELAQAFFPPGVIQALSGDDNLGPWLTAHPGIKKVSFTGSVETGKQVMRSCSTTLKRVTLELGGNDPAIVCPDIDIATMAPKVAAMALWNAGQVCVAVKRVYVHSSIYEKFLSATVDCVKSLKMADGFERSAFVGPIQNSVQYDRLKTFLASIENEKLKVVAGDPKTAATGKGYFISPVVVDNPPENSRLVVEEPFGPIFPLLKWESEDDVIKRANDTDFGLGASIWTNDVEQANRLARKLHAGTVWINHHMESRPDAPFGGHKYSGIGSELGIAGLKSYCNAQVINLDRKGL